MAHIPLVEHVKECPNTRFKKELVAHDVLIFMSYSQGQ